jgi:hypothetical protein
METPPIEAEAKGTTKEKVMGQSNTQTKRAQPGHGQSTSGQAHQISQDKRGLRKEARRKSGTPLAAEAVSESGGAKAVDQGTSQSESGFSLGRRGHFRHIRGFGENLRTAERGLRLLIVLLRRGKASSPEKEAMMLEQAADYEHSADVLRAVLRSQ